MWNHVWDQMYNHNDEPLGILYWTVAGGIAGFLFIAVPTVLENLPVTKWLGYVMEKSACAVGTAARSIHNPDGKG